MEKKEERRQDRGEDKSTKNVERKLEMTKGKGREEGETNK